MLGIGDYGLAIQFITEFKYIGLKEEKITVTYYLDWKF